MTESPMRQDISRLLALAEKLREKAEEHGKDVADMRARLELTCSSFNECRALHRLDLEGLRGDINDLRGELVHIQGEDGPLGLLREKVETQRVRVAMISATSSVAGAAIVLFAQYVLGKV